MSKSCVTRLKCLLCGTDYPPEEVPYVCPRHGDEGILDVQYDYARIAQLLKREDLARSRDDSLWRYKPLLPVAGDAPVPPLRVGLTPLYPARRLEESLGLKHLWVKDETRQPTASLKDRASVIAVVKAAEEEARVITTASTGNAAAALAGICASVGQRNIIFVPASAPEAKVAQLLAYGSEVLLVEGSYDDAFELCLKAARKFGWYNRNTAYNPYMTEGKKTVILEVCEQLGWQAPDAVFVPVGDGCIIGGVHKGLKDLVALGWIDRMPRLIAVQAEGSAALYDAWKRGIPPQEMKPIRASTVADSISAGLPRDRVKALRAVTETGGAFLTVSDEEILQAIPALARATGVFAEPAGAAPLAGLKKALKIGLVQPDQRIVLLVTGSGLKDIQSALRATPRPNRIAPNLEAVGKALANFSPE
jgi:threonine synthase